MTTERIEINPRVMMGKPVIRGTRITVELILKKLSEGETEAELLEDYPRLTQEKTSGRRLPTAPRVWPTKRLSCSRTCRTQSDPEREAPRRELRWPCHPRSAENIKRLLMPEEVKEYCKTSLYVWGHGLNPELVTKLLGVEPDRTIADNKLTHIKGSEKRVAPLKQNTDVTMWVREIEKRRRKETVEEQVTYWCKFLSKRKEAVQRLRKASCEIKIDAFMMERMPLFIDLPTFLSDELSKLKVPVKMTIYDINDPGLRVAARPRASRRRS